MPVMRYFEVTEVRVVRVRAESVSSAVQVADTKLNDVPTPIEVEGNVISGPIVTELHAKEEL